MHPVVLALPANEKLAQALVIELDGEMGAIELRHFPDGETYVRLKSAVEKRSVVIAASLHHPDSKLAPLLFVARAARTLGARSVALATPYLPYMRQDTQFKSGESVTSQHFAEFIGSLVDSLVTVDPHLHRIKALSEIYRIRTEVVHAAPLIGQWIRANVSLPLLIGPDEESVQWVAAVAQAAGAPHVVLKKVRRGDRAVEVSVPQIESWRGHTPVLVDDIASTARTMIETVKHLRSAITRAPLCIAVHPIFSGSAYEDLMAAGPTQIVSCNTIDHVSNAIDVHPMLAQALRTLLRDSVTGSSRSGAVAPTTY
jgi:ribose-phosphate pyrophosphokinase